MLNLKLFKRLKNVLYLVVYVLFWRWGVLADNHNKMPELKPQTLNSEN